MKIKQLYISIFLLTKLYLSSYSDDKSTNPDEINYIQGMRGFVIGISEYIKVYLNEDKICYKILLGITRALSRREGWL